MTMTVRDSFRYGSPTPDTLSDYDERRLDGTRFLVRYVALVSQVNDGNEVNYFAAAGRVEQVNGTLKDLTVHPDEEEMPGLRELVDQVVLPPPTESIQRELKGQLRLPGFHA